ncbi:FYN-binding protein 1 isoform X2 [Erinaceus europaeus]|uniref:FYN-binding protein 1 isoform X2 n=1 Tax=Erinaceus europaeus TaxID=9365 RepID=A0ABM3XDS8_ERIEU|nr:FYN-binding protein 1 isoform X2 [Erinaceus europaeus]
MDEKADVKSLMAKFNTGGNAAEDVSVSGGPFKLSGQNSLSGVQAKKNLFNNQGNAGTPTGTSAVPKFGSPKPPLGLKPSSEEKSDKEPKPTFLKPAGVAQRFGPLANSTAREPEVRVGFPKPAGPKPTSLPKEDHKPTFPWPPANKPSPPAAKQDHDLKPAGPRPGSNLPAQENEQKQTFPKLTGAKGKFASASKDPDATPVFPKPVFGQKLSLSFDDTPEDDSSNKNVSPQTGPPATLGGKSKTVPLKPVREDQGNKEHFGETQSSPFPGVVLKPAGSRGSPGLPRSLEDKKEDRKIDAAKNVFLSKVNQEESTAGGPPAKFSKTPSKVATAGPWSQSPGPEQGSKSLPKQKPLPPLFTLGPPPPKPSRPPHVDLTRFWTAASGNSSNKGHTPYSTAPLPQPPPASQPPLPASHPTQLPAPSLPPRNIKPPLELKSPINEDIQDGLMHSDGTGNLDEEQESEGETYEDIEANKEREKKKEKEEKKRLELEKKEQKEKEKKEQEIKKKFKLTGPIQVIHQAKACCDFKGGKNELSFKQGEQIQIIRITDNPEGKWLGRTAQGSYGYIKTTAVEIDYDSLRRKKTTLGARPPRLPDDDQEVYDDVAEQDGVSSHSQSGSGGDFPPPPDDDIYDGIEEEGDGSFPAPPKQLEDGDEVYDDVGASDDLGPVAEMSQGVKVKTEEKDLKKLKKQEKEEKDFRKKFKYDGEIRVLYETRVTSSLTAKKWGARELQLKPGEALEVIQNTDDTKVLCRNETGKYGYVLRSHLMDNDGEIYDDIADGCIYDND